MSNQRMSEDEMVRREISDGGPGEGTTWLRELLVSACGLGYLPGAPGTWGSLGAAGVALFIWWYLPHAVALPLLGAGVIFCIVVGMRLCPWAEEYYGKKDPGTFVIDEVAGQWLACLLFMWAPGSALAGTTAAFVAFRVFDIIKPPPARKIEQLPGGRGAMLDDLVAALYAAASIWIIFSLRPALFAYPVLSH